MPTTIEHSGTMNNSDVIDLGQLLRAVWHGRATVFMVMGLFFILGVLYLHAATPRYAATLLVAPVSSNNQDTNGGLGGLAALAGISLGQGQAYSPFAVYPVAITSLAVSEYVVRHHPEALHTVFSYQWDAKAKVWKRPEGFGRNVGSVIASVLGVTQPEWSPPDAQALKEYITANLDIVPDTKRPALTITYKNKDVEFAKAFLIILNDATDQVLRRITLAHSTKYEAYIKSKLPTVQQAELKQVLTDQLSQQEILIMLSTSDAPFAAQPLGPPSGSLTPASPNAPYVLVASLFFGAIVGVLLTCFKISIFPRGEWLRAIWRRASTFGATSRSA
jgi:LPS O-antigen subunit length determinant protein (WzzB/FepE family)